MSYKAAFLSYPPCLGGVTRTVVRRNTANTGVANKHCSRVPDICYVKRCRRTLPVCESNCCSTSTIPRSQHCQLAIHLLKSRGQRGASISIGCLAPQLCQHNLVKFRFTVVNFGASTMSVINSEETPAFRCITPSQRKRINDAMPILHVRPELRIRILCQAYQCCYLGCTASTPGGHCRLAQRIRLVRLRHWVCDHRYCGCCNSCCNL